MSKKIDLTGQKFGRLTALSYGIECKWECQCDCGKKTFQKATNLLRRHVISCGCANLERKRFALPAGEAARNKIFGAYKKRNKNFPKLLSLESFLKITQANCFYCDSPPSSIGKSKHGTGDFIYNGIDRVDTLKGYEENNCVPCCKKCNFIK